MTAAQDFAIVSGSVGIEAASTVSQDATSVARLELYIDGLLSDTLDADRGRFNIDTTQLSDGIHEFRIVAIADNAAETEGISIRRFQIDNQGQSVSVSEQRFDGDDQETIEIQVAVAQGDATIDRIELRHLGRAVAASEGLATEIDLSLGLLAYGENTVTPVAVFADGHEVRGDSFVVNRNPELLNGGDVPAPEEQIPGISAEYFFGGGTGSIDASNFTGTPDIETQHTAIGLFHNANGMTFATDNLGELNEVSIRLTGSITVSADNEGEYLWSAINTNDSLRLSVDGRVILSYDSLASGLSRTDGSSSIFLAEGRHDFEILYANNLVTDDGPVLDLAVRGPDGTTRTLSDEFAYTFNEN